MSLALFVLDPLPTLPVVRLDGAEGRHAATVRRVRVGEQLILADGRGARRVGRVVAVGRDHLDVDCEPIEIVPAADPRLVVVQALPKGDRAELSLELLTELGVDEIVPWEAERSVVRWRADRATKGLERWRRTVREASKQSRRARFPVVADPVGSGDLLGLIARTTTLVLHEDAAEALGSVVLPATGDIVVVVGPEGGISPDELDSFRRAGALIVRLGDPVLRTSTAGGAALAVLSVRTGRWGRD